MNLQIRGHGFQKLQGKGDFMNIIGRYKEIYNSEKYPTIRNDLNHPSQYKDLILDYMKKCKTTSSAPAIIHDVISNQKVDIPLECKTDGIYGWRTDIIYYIEQYDLKLPDDFISHVLAKTAQQ